MILHWKNWQYEKPDEGTRILHFHRNCGESLYGVGTRVGEDIVYDNGGSLRCSSLNWIPLPRGAGEEYRFDLTTVGEIVGQAVCVLTFHAAHHAVSVGGTVVHRSRAVEPCMEIAKRVRESLMKSLDGVLPGKTLGELEEPRAHVTWGIIEEAVARKIDRAELKVSYEDWGKLTKIVSNAVFRFSPPTHLPWIEWNPDAKGEAAPWEYHDYFITVANEKGLRSVHVAKFEQGEWKSAHGLRDGFRVTHFSLINRPAPPERK